MLQGLLYDCSLPERDQCVYVWEGDSGAPGIRFLNQLV